MKICNNFEFLLHYVPKNLNWINGKRGECPNLITRFTNASLCLNGSCRLQERLNSEYQNTASERIEPIVHGLAAAIIWICATFFHRCWLTILWANFADQTQIKNQQVFIKAFFCKVLFQIGVNCFRLIWGWDAKNKQRKKRARI